MASSKALFVLFIMFYIRLIDVDALKTCNQSIIKHIKSTYKIPTGVLLKLSSQGTFTYALNPVGSVPDSVKCVNGQIYPPRNGKSKAEVTAYYKNITKSPAKIEYTQQEAECGHIWEWDTSNKEYQIYVLKAGPVFCYYRCTTYATDGVDFGACGVPVDKQNDAKVKIAIKECKDALKAAGLTPDLVYIDTCKTT